MTATYTLRNHDFLLAETERPYVLKVRDLADEDKPRERMLREGPGALSIHELLAVVLMTGTKSEGVLEMAHRVLREYGEKSALSSMDAKAMSEDLGIPLSKAAQIVACGELGRRFFKGSRNGAPVIRTARDVFEYVADMRSLPKEHVRGLYLNSHYQLVHDETISIGTLDANIVHPREVFRPAIAHAAAGVIVVHNHPSGVTTPSEADRMVTRELARAGHVLGIDLVDHVVVTSSAYTSLIQEEA